MAAEIRLHLELQAERNIAAGMDPTEARYAAQRQFGGVEQVKERCRDQRGWSRLDQVIKDLRFAGRQLLKTPAFTLTAVITLGMGIGLNTAAFSLVNTLLLRPLPFEHPESLVQLRRSTRGDSRAGFAPADYLDLKRAEGPFGMFAGYSGQDVSLAEPGRPAEFQDARKVSADYFNVLGVRPEIGRAFVSDDDIYGRHRVVVLSHALWENRFDSRKDVIGRMIRMDGEQHEIVGVLPAWASDDRVNGQTALFRPLAFTAKERDTRTSFWVEVIGRRSAALTEAQGNEFVAAFGSRVTAAFPTEDERGTWQCERPLGALGNSAGRAIMAMLLGLSGCVVLIACSNLANLLLARAIGRSQELAVRAALGASRVQLLRPLVVESLVLALVGGTAALPVSAWALHWFSDQSVASGGAPISFPLDGRVFGFALGVSILAALFFGAGPALVATGLDVNAALKRGARGITTSRGHQRLRHLLIIGQFATAMILVAGAGLLARGAGNFMRMRVGWNADSVVQGRFELAKTSYPESDQILAFYAQLLDRLRLLPGVQAASVSYGLPYDGPFGPRSYLVDGHDRPVKGHEPVATFNGVAGDYFTVVGIPLLRGRVFNAGDTASSPKVCIINETMARSLFPDESPIGRRLAVVGTEKPDSAEIVGVVGDVRSVAVYQRPVPFQTYHPFSQEAWPQAKFAVRVSGTAPGAVLASLRSAIAGLDPDLPVRELMTADAAIEHYAFELTMLRNIFSAFALLGLGLAAIGIYGVIARDVARRRGEIGIRMALGADVADIVRMVLGSGVRLVLIGAGLGVLGAFGLSRFVGSIMPSLQTNGDLVLGASTAVLVLVATTGCYLPARKAAKIDPMTALRAE
jgi:predicted permease